MAVYELENLTGKTRVFRFYAIFYECFVYFNVSLPSQMTTTTS